MNSIVIPRRLLEEIAAQARAEAPRECCGLLGGRQSRVASRYALRNAAARAEVAYFAEPADLFAAMRLMRERGEELLVIYHSHPRGSARPSASDLALSFYPEAAHLIIALAPREEQRLYRLAADSYTEIAIEEI
jgi:proteasome lid subunit RPN8/RPN11